MHQAEKNISLDIAISTFNHSLFIAKTLDSILSQKVNFDYRIIILDDCSTDNNEEIIRKIAQQNPDKIEYYRNEKNLGPFKTANILAKKVSAKYLCFLDGDDYWCFDEKLQTQIDFLENNLDYEGCFHDAKISQHNDSDNVGYLHRTQKYWKSYSQFNNYTSDFMPWDLVQRNIVPTASLIFRNQDIAAFLQKFKASELSLNWAIHLEIIKHSKFKYFNETWSIYNDHPNGISKRYDLLDFKRNNIKILESLLEDSQWLFFASEIYMTICSEYRYLLKTEKALKLPAKEYNSILKKYKYYLNKFQDTDLKHLKKESKDVRNNGLVD